MIEKMLKKFANKINEYYEDKERIISYRNKSDRKDIPEIKFTNQECLREHFGERYDEKKNWDITGEGELNLYIFEKEARLYISNKEFGVIIAEGNTNLLLRFVYDNFPDNSFSINIGVVCKNVWTGEDIYEDKFVNRPYEFEVKKK